MRLDRILANSGCGSRKEAQSLIRSGAVSLDGQVLARPEMKLGEAEMNRLQLSGRPLRPRFHFYLALYKPAGYLSALQDARRPTVAELLPPEQVALGLFPIGRLDLDTTGLLLFTNDGQLGHRLCKPEWGVRKRYRFAYAGEAFAETEVALWAEGLRVGDWRCRPARLALLEPGLAELEIEEGKFHQVKRMVAARGRALTRLTRLSHGPITLEGLDGPGCWRELGDQEVDQLYACCDLTRPGR